MNKEALRERDIVLEFEGAISQELRLRANNAFVINSQFILQLHDYHPTRREFQQPKLGIFAPWELAIERLAAKKKGRDLSSRNPKEITFVSLTISDNDKYTLIGDKLITFVSRRLKYLEIEISYLTPSEIVEINHHLNELDKSEACHILGVEINDTVSKATVVDIENRKIFEVERASNHRSMKRITSVESEFLRKKELD